MFCSSSVPRNRGMRNKASAMIAAGRVADTVCPARIPRYAFAEPKTRARKRPSATAFTVSSLGSGFFIYSEDTVLLSCEMLHRNRSCSSTESLNQCGVLGINFAELIHDLWVLLVCVLCHFFD